MNARSIEKQTVKLPRLILRLTMVLAGALLVVTPVSAVTYGGGNVQGYASDSELKYGTIVVLTGKDSNRVKPATKDNIQNMFGVTVDPNRLPLTLSNEGVENESFVAVSGTYNVLVSTEGGPIVAGGYITLSSISGVAMNAGSEKVTVFGRANENFDGKGLTLGEHTLTDTGGNQTKAVKLGIVPVTVDIRNNPNDISTDVNVPEPLRRLGQAIAQKEVSPVRIYLSLAIAVISVVAAIAILYAGVRSGVISIGRNPMSRKSIFRALLEIILTCALILTIGFFAVYLLLRL